MIHGLDTGFLVAAEVREHGTHADARATLAQVLTAGDVIAIAPQVLVEFIHWTCVRGKWNISTVAMNL
jgi:predicted nucleic acid-binding protein